MLGACSELSHQASNCLSAQVYRFISGYLAPAMFPQKPENPRKTQGICRRQKNLHTLLVANHCKHKKYYKYRQKVSNDYFSNAAINKQFLANNCSSHSGDCFLALLPYICMAAFVRVAAIPDYGKISVAGAG